jgi:hypothetical protein
MAEAVNDLVIDVGRLLVDVAHTHWPALVLVDYLNEGQLLIAQMDPAASYIEETFTPDVDSSHQLLPNRALQLVDVTHNTTSKITIRRVDKLTLDIEVPGWEAETSAAEGLMWCPDETDDQSFYISPPATAASRYDIKYTKIPDVVGVGDNIDLQERYYVALIDYMVARALSEDGDNQDVTKSDKFYAAFVNRMKMSGPRPT